MTWEETADSEKISYLFYVNKLLEKSTAEIYREYSLLERKYHDLLDSRWVDVKRMPAKEASQC
jgi:hypothetical protein